MKKGFTLIELMVVITVIAILTGIVISNISSARKKSRDAKRVADMAELQLALELYYDKTHKYPATLTNGELAPTYISSIPTPGTGTTQTAYAYVPIGSSCGSYHLGTILETASNTLSQDAQASPASTGVPATNCGGSGSPASADFHGNSDDCVASSGASGTGQCYDVKP